MLLSIDFLVLPPTEEEEDTQCDNNADGRQSPTKGGPIELQQSIGVMGLVQDLVVIGLLLVSGLGRKGRLGLA